MTASRVDQKGIIVACPSCGKPNRLAFASLGKPSRCGRASRACRCRRRPSRFPTARRSTRRRHERAAAHRRLLGAVVRAVPHGRARARTCRARDAGALLVVKVNTDEVQDDRQPVPYQSIPTLAVVYRGREIQRVAGARSAADIIAFVRESLAEAERQAS